MHVRHGSVWLRTVGALVSAGALLAACTKSLHASTGAPPVVICGTVLSAAPAGATVEDVTRDHADITEATVGGDVFVQVSDSCKHGATVNWTPHAAAKLIKQALAKDGKPAAVVLQPGPLPTHFSLTATREGVRVAYATVTLSN